MSKIFQIIHRTRNISILCHIQVRVNLHGSSDAGMPNIFAKCGKVKIRIVFMVQIIVGHISVPESMHGDIVSQTNLLANLTMRLAGAAADTATKGEVGRTADVLVLPTDGIVLLFDNPLG